MKKERKAEIARLMESGDWIHVAGSRRNIKEHEYYPIVEDLLGLNEVQALKDFKHHIVTNRFQHSLNVSYYNYRLCRLLRLDAESAARAGLLHDLYDYDTKHYTSGVHHLRHSAYHPMVALERAESIVPINDRERDMIVKHMWPVTPARPKYAETYVLTFVDKYCAVIEFLLPQPKRFRAWAKKRRDDRKEKRREKALLRTLSV